MMAIFDLAYSMRMGPRSEESRYVPCSVAMAEPAHSASLNSTNATGAVELLVGDCDPPPDEVSDEEDDMLAVVVPLC